jgi:hypothetical protein
MNCFHSCSPIGNFLNWRTKRNLCLGYSNHVINILFLRIQGQEEFYHEFFVSCFAFALFPEVPRHLEYFSSTCDPKVRDLGEERGSTSYVDFGSHILTRKWWIQPKCPAMCLLALKWFF